MSLPDTKKEQIIENGLGLFEIGGSGNYVFPLGDHATIYEYVTAHRTEPDIAQAEEKKLTKKQLYNRLVKAATAGKMVEYRTLRKQYSALV